MTLLLYADRTDQTVSNMAAVLTVAGIVLAAAAAAFVPVLIAWSRRSAHAQPIMAIAFLWALSATISASLTVLAEMKYSQQHLQQIQSGYFDPTDTTDAPPLPWAVWSVLATAYVGLVIWPLVVRR